MLGNWHHITGKEILPLDMSRVYSQNHTKPCGFWISEGEWLEWMRNEGFSPSGVDFKYDVEVDFSEFFVVRTLTDLESLEKKYQRKSRLGEGYDVYIYTYIDWCEVAKDYPGVYFDNYNVVKRDLISKTSNYGSWFLGVDVRSACIFDLGKCLRSIKKDPNYEF